LIDLLNRSLKMSEEKINTDTEFSLSPSSSTNYLESDSDLDIDMEEINLIKKISNFNQIDTYQEPRISDYDIIDAYRWKTEIDNLQVNWYSSIEKYCPNFKGYVWRLCDDWFNIIDLNKTTKIHYLEIGTLCGANLISVCKHFTHPKSTFECVDPWEDHNEYDEYKLLQESNFNNFIHNINESEEADRITYYKDYSHSIFPILTDESYDLIYIDGNHKSWAVIEDGVHSFRKCKKGGWIIFDDYNFSDETKYAIDSFIGCFKEKCSEIIIEYGQCFIKKNVN
jgi:hypothetical protein